MKIPFNPPAFLTDLQKEQFLDGLNKMPPELRKQYVDVLHQLCGRGVFPPDLHDFYMSLGY